MSKTKGRTRRELADRRDLELKALCEKSPGARAQEETLGRVNFAHGQIQ
jgi:hypothetical protein